MKQTTIGDANMCGIVGMAGNLLSSDDNLFKSMLFMDTIRGKHATGVAVVKGLCREVNTFKMAYSAPVFLELKETSNILQGFAQNTVAIGHNRHATKGSATDHKGAHPFTSGHITLVHNGSLTSHHSLTTGHFTVDSEAICEAIAVDGAEAVLPKLQGAYSLVWINELTQTLNFARNDERPMNIATSEKRGKIYWASEADMLTWLLDRSGISTPNRHFDKLESLEVGQWRSYPITATGINLDGMTEVPFSVARPVVYQGYQGGHGRTTGRMNTVTTNQKPGGQGKAEAGQSTGKDGNVSKTNSDELAKIKVASRVHVHGETTSRYKFGKTREDALMKLAKKTIETAGLNNRSISKFIELTDAASDGAVLDERIMVWPTGFVPYSKHPQSGYITGIMGEYPFADVIIHSCTEKSYIKIQETCEMGITAYVVGIQPPLTSHAPVTDKTLGNFKLLLDLMTVRAASLEDFNYDVDRAPEDKRNDIEIMEELLIQAAEEASDVNGNVDLTGPEDDPKLLGYSGKS